MNDRLISAEKLLNNYQELCEGLACINCPFFGLDNRCGLWLVLQEQIVDAVEVVRCKDCKWRIGLRCYHKRSSMDDLVGENDYCSWGERRENADK